jgi:signal transduction histidine kinase
MTTSKLLIVKDEETTSRGIGVSRESWGQPARMSTTTTDETPNATKDGKFLGAMAGILDETDCGYTEDEGLPVKKNTERAIQDQSEYLETMSHEFRTPLHSILGYCELLEASTTGTLSNTQSNYLTSIKEGGFHLLDLITTILDLSQIEANSDEIEIKPFDFSEMLRKTISVVTSIAEKKGVGIKRQIHPAIGWYSGGEIQIKQIMFNLLSNAIKFTPGGKKVGVEAIPLKNEIRVAIWDEGIGIPADSLVNIFAPFQRLNDGPPSDDVGTGLGLTISKRLIEQLHGYITVISKLGEGSKFTFTLPDPLKSGLR